MGFTPLGIAIAGLASSVVGTIVTGVQARNQARFQEQVAQQQADRAILVAQAKERDFRKQISRQFAAARAGTGELQGSQLLSMENFVAEAELDALTIRNQGVAQSQRLQQQANLFSTAGNNAVVSSGFRAGAQLLTGFSKLGKFGGSGVGTNEVVGGFELRD